MTGTFTFDRRHRRRAAVLKQAAAWAGVAAFVIGASVAQAGERKRAGDCEQLACALAAGARQQSGRESSDKRDEHKSDRDGRHGRSGADYRSGPGASYDLGWGYGKGIGETRAPRPPEWEETQVFMRQYAPRRNAAVDQMKEGEAKESVKKFLFARFRGLQSLRRRDPAGYEQRLAQLRVEDQVFGIVSDWGDASDGAARQELRDALRTQVGQLVDLDLQERRRRVESLKRDLAEQTELLARDEKQRDLLVDKRFTRFADWADRWAARRKQDEAEKIMFASKQGELSFGLLNDKSKVKAGPGVTSANLFR